MRPLRGLQETRVATREESGVLGFPSRRGLTPRGSLECNPEIPDYINDDLKYHHLRYNSKTMSQIMEAAINGRAALRENPEAFVRYNTLKKDFEVYEPKR